MALEQRLVAEVLGQGGLAHARGAAQQDVVAAAQESQRQELVVQGAVEFLEVRPVQVRQRCEAAQGGQAGAALQVAVVAAGLLQGNQLLQDLQGGLAAPGGLCKEVLQGFWGQGEAQGAERLAQLRR